MENFGIVWGEIREIECKNNLAIVCVSGYKSIEITRVISWGWMYVDYENGRYRNANDTNWQTWVFSEYFVFWELFCIYFRSLFSYTSNKQTKIQNKRKINKHKNFVINTLTWVHPFCFSSSLYKHPQLKETKNWKQNIVWNCLVRLLWGEHVKYVDVTLHIKVSSSQIYSFYDECLRYFMSAQIYTNPLFTFQRAARVYMAYKCVCKCVCIVHYN